VNGVELFCFIHRSSFEKIELNNLSDKLK